MKILFFISVHGHGRGGHFHSLNHISSALSRNNDIKIVSFGPGRSKVLEANQSFVKNLNFNGLNLLGLRKEINKIRNEFKPDIYHCFDVGCYNILRLLLDSNKHKVFVNKCGGPNPIDYPFIPNLVLFSKENLEWFNLSRRHKNSNIFLIPNRVETIKLDNLEKKKELLNSDVFNFVRISRIGDTYAKSLADSINLISRLSMELPGRVRLLIIGTVENQKAYETLSNHEQIINGNMILLTDEESTKEASKMLYLANAVIGTGRGLMEAASLSLPVLAINSDGNYPVLLNKSNFEDAFRTNFSERNTFPFLSEEDNYKNIRNLIVSPKDFKQSAEFSHEMFKEFFSLEVAERKYLRAYSSAKLSRNYNLRDSKFILKSILLFFLSSLKKIAI